MQTLEHPHHGIHQLRKQAQQRLGRLDEVRSKQLDHAPKRAAAGDWDPHSAMQARIRRRSRSLETVFLRELVDEVRFSGVPGEAELWSSSKLSEIVSRM